MQHRAVGPFFRMGSSRQGELVVAAGPGMCAGLVVKQSTTSPCQQLRAVLDAQAVAVTQSMSYLLLLCRWIYIQLAVAMYIVWVTPVRVVGAGSAGFDAFAKLKHATSLLTAAPRLAHVMLTAC